MHPVAIHWGFNGKICLATFSMYIITWYAIYGVFGWNVQFIPISGPEWTNTALAAVH
jgi:hypothetical protein